MSPMIFDSGESLFGWTLFLSVCSFPLLTLITIPGSWVLYRQRAYRGALVLSLLPLINVLIVATVFAMPARPFVSE